MSRRMIVSGLFLLSGITGLIHEIVWIRLFSLGFGSAAQALSTVVSVYLGGLALGAFGAGKLAAADGRQGLRFYGFAEVLTGAYACAVPWLIQSTQPVLRAVYGTGNGALVSTLLVRIVLCSAVLMPASALMGTTLPSLAAWISSADPEECGRKIGFLYTLNLAGASAGAFLSGFALLPAFGFTRTLLLACALNAALGMVAILLAQNEPSREERAHPASPEKPEKTAARDFLPTRLWIAAAFTSGEPSNLQPFEASDLVFLRERVSGTVAVRKEGRSLLLSIDGKVDASDAGGDLLTEKLFAHIPFTLNPNARRVCLIGLASGVTAGAILTHPIYSLDVLELSRDVVSASHFYYGVNLRPLDDRRVSLLVNEGRNHLALTSSRYDTIISEPSNPWIAGMNNLFTSDFFRLARDRLNPGGIFAHWFHIYNMPKDDLKSLLRSFADVFPSAMLWQMNDGDVLLTGFVDTPNLSGGARLTTAAAADLSRAGVSDPSFLWNMYVMRDADIRRFAADAPPDTDDDPRLEFHGQRDLHAQTDILNAADFASFSKQLPPPATAQTAIAGMTTERLLSYAAMFENAESGGSAFRYYRLAFLKADSKAEEALAGMDRCARLPEERSAVALALALPQTEPDTLASRTTLALEKARAGDNARARFLFAEYAAAHPRDSAARLNYRLFCPENKRYEQAIEQFGVAISLNPAYLPAIEALAETYLEMRDVPNSILWSRRILEIDPNHAIAKRTLAALEREAR